MANVTVRHRKVTGAGPNPAALVDGPAWDDEHDITGIENVDNTSDADKPVSTAQATAIGAVQSDISAHKADTSNPHGVTKAQVGLGNVDNTSDATKNAAEATLTHKTINGADNTLNVRLGNDVSGVLPVANGGTGANDAAGARTNIMGDGTWTGNTVSLAMAQDSGAAGGSVRCVAAGSGDSNLAGISFLINGAYGINLGMRADGYFGLGGFSSTPWRWYSASNGNMVAAGDVTGNSDPGLKKDVQRIEGALALLEKIEGVRFTWRDNSKLIGKPGERDIGVLADQVEAVLPEMVSLSVPDDDNAGKRWRTVAYAKFVPVLIEAIKELADEIRALKAAR